MSKQPRRFSQYQVDSPKYGGVKLVAELTEHEAKMVVCDLLTALDKIEDGVERASGAIRNARCPRERPDPPSCMSNLSHH